jgi:hypothetical protein
MKASRVLFVTAIAIAALSGCRKHDRPERQNPGNGGGNDNGGTGHQTEQTVFQLKENKNWVITYGGKDVREGAKVEVINIDNVPSNIIYIVSVINEANYATYLTGKEKGEGLKDFMKAELEVAGDYIYTGSPEEILFDPFRHGDWYAFIMALDSDHKLTGEYAYTMFEVQEEEATEDFNKWLGNWTATQGKYSYNLTISSLEANFIYKVEGWETGDYLQEQMNLEYLETFYDKGRMYFVSQYIQTYYDEDLQTDMEECFLGEIYYKGIMSEHGYYLIQDEGLDLAYAALTDDSSANIVPCDISVDIDGEDYKTSFNDMKYFIWSVAQKQWFHFNDEVATLPMTMKRVEAAPTTTKSVTAMRGQKTRPLRGKVFVPKEQKKAVKAVKL